MAEADADTRTPAQIEADIRRRRERLAETLDEIAVRVHPKTIAQDAVARASAGVDRSLGRVYDTAGRAVTGTKQQFVTVDGALRYGRIVPVVLAVVGVVGLFAVGAQRRRR